MDLLASVTQECKKILEESRESLITKDIIVNYKSAIDRNLHSILQRALIIAGEKNNLISLPECRIMLTRPIDPKNYGLKGRRRYKCRVDVAFLDKSDLRFVGFGEVYTIDTVHTCYKPLHIEELKWITDRIRVPHILEYGKFFHSHPLFISVVTLPRNAIEKPKWKDQEKLLEGSTDYYQKFSGEWKKFINELRKSYSVNLVILTEQEIEIY